MKKVIISSFIFLFMIGICLYDLKVINEVFENSTSYTSRLSKLNTESTYKDLTKTFKEFQEYWGKKSNILATIGHHDILSKVEENLAALESMINLKNFSSIPFCIDQISATLKELLSESEISLKNIL